MSSPFLDTNVFLHAIANDPNSAECSAFLKTLESSTQLATLDIVVLHELTYVIPRYLKGISKLDLARLLMSLIEMPGIIGDKILFGNILSRWSQTPGLGFVDAYLAAIATQEEVAVFTKNVRELRGQGVVVPDPLPG